MEPQASCQLSPCKAFLDSLPQGLDGNLSYQHGFLPATIPITPLPGPYRVWEDAATQLRGAIFGDATQSMLASMPVLPADSVSLPDEHLRRAGVLMTLLASAYWRFGIDRMFLTRNTHIDDSLPDSLLVPWKEICRRFGRKRQYPTIDDYLLNNFTMIDAKNVDSDGRYQASEVIIENIKNLIPILDNEAERIFYSSIVEVHAVASPVVREICYMQHRILESGSEASEDIAQALIRCTACIKKATRAILKITAQEKSRTYCDPILWSKTVAIFNLPPASYPSGTLSGSGSAFVHTMDALVGRVHFKTQYGQYSKSIYDQYLTSTLRRFLEKIQEVSIRDYVAGLKSVDESRFLRTSAAFNDLVDCYAGPDGFLGKHIAKVVHYLGIGTLVGRNQSTSNDERYIRRFTWSEVSQQLRIAADERLDGKTNSPPIAQEPAELLPPTGLPFFSIVEVVKHRSRGDAWLVLHERVVDVTDYLSKHPGGTEVMCANLGRDASTDFVIIDGHARELVRRLLVKMTIGALRRVDTPGVNKWYRLLDHLTLLYNSFQIQFTHHSDDIHRLVFCAQSYSHFLDEHIMDTLELLNRCAETVPSSNAADLGRPCAESMDILKERVKAIIRSTDATAAADLVLHIQKKSCLLLDGLIDMCSAMLLCLESGAELPPDQTRLHAEWMVAAIKQWAADESAFLKSQTLKN